MTDLLIHDATVVTVNQEHQIPKNGSIRELDVRTPDERH